MAAVTSSSKTLRSFSIIFLNFFAPIALALGFKVVMIALKAVSSTVLTSLPRYQNPRTHLVDIFINVFYQNILQNPRKK
jgi:hypothetical protein